MSHVALYIFYPVIQMQIHGFNFEFVLLFLLPSSIDVCLMNYVCLGKIVIDGHICLWMISLNDFFDCSPGIMLLIYTRASSHVPLKILNIEDGSVLKSFNHLLHRNKKVNFIEQFNEKLLVKQENENLQILDVSLTVIWVFLTKWMAATNKYVLHTGS